MPDPSAHDPTRRDTRLLLELGRGGMGIVYLARSVGPGGFAKLKVIKRLLPDLADDPRARQMFLDEAKLAARLHHPNVVQTNEVGFDGKHYFMEMEYLEGQSYDALLRRAQATGTAVPLEDSLWVLTQALEGLHYAHELADLDGTPLRVVHRDVSPHNVFVTYDGNVKVLDFGIAKAADSQGETTTGAVKGKVTYMAPEQAATRQADRRADVFAVGVMLWQALAGQRLWAGLSDFQIFVKLQEGRIPAPSSVTADVPPELEAACMRALAMKPEDRYATAEDFRAELEAHLEKTGARVGPRSVAKLMQGLFSEKRRQVHAQIEAQIRSPASEVHTSDAPAIGDSPSRTGAGQATTKPDLRDTSEARRSNRALRVAILVALVTAAAAAAGSAVVTRKATGGGAAAAGSATMAAVPRECDTNAACVNAHDGRPWICRREQGRCAPLESEDCRVIADPGDPGNDRTIWLGTMFPTSGPNAFAGVEFVRAAELARLDFAQIVHGIPSQVADAPPLPLGLLACDDARDANRAARHLVDDVGVPAVMGFGSSQEAVDLTTNVFVPRRVLTIVALNQASFITSIPQPAGEPRLVWRTLLSAAGYQVAVAAVVRDLLEPRIRAASGVNPGAPIRVAFVRSKTAFGLSLADALLPTLRFNGGDIVQNERNFRQIVIGSHEDYAAAVAELLVWRPHLILYDVSDRETLTELMPPLEERWPATERFRPYFLTGGSLVKSDALFKLLGKNAERRRRYLGITPPANTVLNMKFTLRYNETFTPKVTLNASPASPYDSVYLLAYAAYAAGDAPLTGPNLSRAIPRLLPPGRDIEVGPGAILEALATLRRGENIDLRGAQTPLDFDLATGETSSDIVVQCVGVDEHGMASDGIDSGVTYDAKTGRLLGSLSCP